MMATFTKDCTLKYQGKTRTFRQGEEISLPLTGIARLEAAGLVRPHALLPATSLFRGVDIVPSPSKVAEFDIQKWAGEIELGVHNICDTFPGSLRDWLREKRHDLYAAMIRAEQDIDDGYEGRDAGRLRRGLDQWQAVLAEGLLLYRGTKDIPLTKETVGGGIIKG